MIEEWCTLCDISQLLVGCHLHWREGELERWGLEVWGSSEREIREREKGGDRGGRERRGGGER